MQVHDISFIILGLESAEALIKPCGVSAIKVLQTE